MRKYALSVNGVQGFLGVDETNAFLSSSDQTESSMDRSEMVAPNRSSCWALLKYLESPGTDNMLLVNYTSFSRQRLQGKRWLRRFIRLTTVLFMLPHLVLGVQTEAAGSRRGIR